MRETRSANRGDATAAGMLARLWSNGLAKSTGILTVTMGAGDYVCSRHSPKALRIVHGPQALAAARNLTEVACIMRVGRRFKPLSANSIFQIVQKQIGIEWPRSPRQPV